MPVSEISSPSDASVLGSFLRSLDALLSLAPASSRSMPAPRHHEAFHRTDDFEVVGPTLFQ